MKKSEKTNNRTALKWLGILLGVGTLGYFGWQVYKNMKKIENNEKKEKEDLENLGVSSEKMKKEVKPHENQNFVKKLYVSTAFKAEAIVPDDSLDTEEAWEQANVIHIFQRHRSEVNTHRNFRDCHNRNYLEFVLGIPDYLDRSTKLHISDYIKCMKDASDHMSSNIVKFSPYAEKELFGFLKIKYDNPNYDEDDEFSYKELEGFIELPSWTYACFENEKGHGLTELYKKVIIEKTFGEAEDAIQRLLKEKYPETNVTVLYMGLAYRIVFPIQDEINTFGITLSSALDCIDYLCNEFVVDKSHSNKYGYVSGNDETIYDLLLFHAPDKSGNWSWEKFYDIKDNQVICLDYNDR